LPKGWKQYKRTEAFWQNRLMPDGKPVSPKFLLNELQYVLNKNKNKKHPYCHTEHTELVSVSPSVTVENYERYRIKCGMTLEEYF